MNGIRKSKPFSYKFVHIHTTYTYNNYFTISYCSYFLSGFSQDVRKTRGLDIDMRIGVHSGKIFSGILGVCKWQYDIWSQDVVIANHMEQTGRPG